MNSIRRGTSEMPLVVIVTPSTNPNVGGVERFAKLIADALTGAFDVVIMEAPGTASKWARRLGVSPLIRARAARQGLLELGPSFVITNGGMGAVGRGRWKRIHVYHGTAISHSTADRLGRRKRDWLLAGALGGGLSEFLSGLGAVKVAVSETAKRELKSWYGFRDVLVIENGVKIPTQNVGRSEKRNGLIFVGRRESRKGYEGAVAIAAKNGEVLSVAGPGRDFRTNDLGLLTESEVADAFADSLAFIFPTRYEACSFSILESLAAGCPVVTTDVGWITSLLSSVPSYRQLIFSGDSEIEATLILERLVKSDSTIWDAVEDAGHWVRANNSSAVFGAKWLSLVRGLK